MRVKAAWCPPSRIHSIPRGIVIVPPQQVGSRHPPASNPSDPDRRRHWLALGLAGALHVLFLLVLWLQMRPPVIETVVRAGPDDVLRVRLIESRAPAAAAAPPPPSVPAPPPSRAPTRPLEPPARDAMTLQTPASAATTRSTDQPPRLYDRQGQPLLPPAAASSVPAPDYVQRRPQGDERIMRHDSPVTYRASRFDKDWSGGGNAIDGALQKLVDKATVKKTVRLPGGIRLHCSAFIFAGGCVGDPPAPPSAKDGDARLSMAPARPLDGDAHVPVEKPDIEACIAMYRAGKPLEWGCPSNTPNLSVDAEMRERAEGKAGQP